MTVRLRMECVVGMTTVILSWQNVEDGGFMTVLIEATQSFVEGHMMLITQRDMVRYYHVLKCTCFIFMRPIITKTVLHKNHSFIFFNVNLWQNLFSVLF